MRLDDVHMRTYGSLPLPKAVAGQVATAKTAFADAAGTLHLPYARFQANTGHMLLAIITVEVIDLRLQILRRHEKTPLLGRDSLPGVVVVFWLAVPLYEETSLKTGMLRTTNLVTKKD